MTRQMETSLSITCLLCGFKATSSQVDLGLSEVFMRSALEHADAHDQHKVEVTYKAVLYSENYREPAEVVSAPIQPELPSS